MNTEEIIKELEALKEEAERESELLSNCGHYQGSDIWYAREMAYEHALEIIKKHKGEEK